MPTLAELYGQPEQSAPAQPNRKEPTLADLYGTPEANAVPEPTLADLYGAPESPETAIQRKPADDDGQRHGWNFMDTVIAGAPAVADAWQNMVPGLNQAIITDYEAAPNANRGGWWGKAVDTVSDIGSSVVSGAAGAALGGPIGMGITGAADQLGRNFEDKIIEGARERMAADPMLPKQEAADQAFRAGEGRLDAGDYAESALSGVFAYGGGKVGEKAFRKVAESGFPTVRRLVQGSAAPVAYDAATGGLQGAASVLNRENVDSVGGAVDALTDSGNLKQIATGAAIGAGMSVGGQAAQGLGVYKRGNRPGITSAREAELQSSLEREQMLADNAVERQRIADVEARAAQTRDLVEQERAETNRVQEEQSIIEARRNIDAARRQALREAQEAEAAFRENPTMENAQARVDAIDRANELANVPEFEGAQAQPEQPRLALPMPEGMTAGEFPGRMINPTKGGGSSELPTREGQGQATGRPFGLSPLRRQSQAIEATPPTAGEGVINQRGEQIPMPGEPVKRTSIGMNRLQRGQGASSPIEQQEQFNPELGQFKTSTLGDAEQPVVDMSYTDADALQRARRGTIPVADTLAAGEQIARQKGADLVSTWKPGKAFNAEEHSAVRSYVGGLNEKIADLEARDSSFLNPTDRGELFKAHEELFKATAAMVGTKTEAGRALRAMRESFAPVQFDPETGKAVKPPVSDSPNISVDDRTKAATYLTKLYGDKPVPQSVIDEIAGLKPDDAEGLFKILQRQTKVNNKTKPIDAFVNAVRAGMLTGVRTLERNFGGIGANVALRDVTQRVGSVLDWAMSKGTKQRTITSIGLSPLVRNAKSAVGEGAKEGWQVLTGKSSPTEIRSSMERMELSREQYTGDRLFNKALDKSVNTVFRAMAAADLPGRKFAYKNSILDQAQAVAKTEVLQGAIHKSEYKNRVKELALAPTDAMKLEAGLQSEMAVFAEENIASKGLSLFKNFIYGNLEKRGTFGRIGAGGLKIGEAFTTPFLKTPANISWDVLTRVLSDLPAGVGKAAQVALRKEPMTAAEQKFIAESIARGGVGLGIAMTGYILGVKGSDLLSGTSEQETTSMRETNQVAGKQPGSATIGGKNARIQEVFSPASNILVWGYSVGRESVKPLKNEESRLGNVLGASAKVVTENPMNEGIERVSKLGQPGGIQNFAAGSVSALVPTIVSDVATLGDDTQRDSHKQPGDSFGDVIVKSIQRRLPGLRNKLPAKVNAFGQVETEDRWNVIDPTFRRDAKWQKDKAIGELVRLNVGLPKPKRRENETEQQYLARVKRNGDAIKNKLDTFVSGKGYNAMSDDIKRDRLYKITHSPSINTLDKIR